MARGKQRCAYFPQYSDGYLWSCRFSNEIYTVLKDVDKVLMDHFVRFTVRVRVLQFGFEDLGISFREFSPAKIALVSVSINFLVLSDRALCSIHLIPPIPTPLIGSPEKNHPLGERF